MRGLRGLDLPRRIGIEELTAFEPEQAKVLGRELAAIDEDMREILSRVEVMGARLSPTGSFRTLQRDLSIPRIVSSLPTLPNALYPNGSLVLLVPDWKVYRNAGGSWTTAVDAVDLDGEITETQIADDAITTPKIAANAVVASKILVSSLSAISASMGTLTAGKIDVGNIEINADTERILFGSATAPTTGTGIFMGLSGGVYHFRVGNPAGDYIHWNGSTLEINGEAFTGANPVFDGQVEFRAGEGAPRVTIIADAGNGAIELYDQNDDLRATMIAGVSAYVVQSTGAITLQGVGDITLTTDADVVLDPDGGNFLVINNLPTINPGGTNRVWRDSGTLKIT